jgi:Zn-dependent protease with chaperone function
MFPKSLMMGPLFWIILGLIYAVMLHSYYHWTRNQNIKMNWWKWLLSVSFYILLSLSIATGFTLFGEGEIRPGTASIVVFGVLSILFGVLLFRFVLKPVKPK